MGGRCASAWFTGASEPLLVTTDSNSIVYQLSEGLVHGGGIDHPIPLQGVPLNLPHNCIPV